MAADVSSAPSNGGGQELLPNEIPGFLVTWMNNEGEREEGPLSLLWQLIESYRVDIFDVSLYQITEDFFEFVRRAGELQVGLASAFIVMAARLLFYKSRALLPDPGFDEPDTSPRLPPELIQQLLEYRKFQLAAEKLREVEEIASGIFARPPVASVPASVPGQEEEEWFDLDVVDLVRAYSDVMQRLEKKSAEKREMEVNLESYSVDERVQYIRALVQESASFSFHDLFENLASMLKIEVVVTFLAILELVKLAEIIVRQNLMFGEIRIFRKGVVVH